MSAASSYDSLSSYKLSPMKSLSTSIKGLSSYRNKNNFVMLYAVDKNIVFCIQLVSANKIIANIHVVAGNGTAGYNGDPTATNTLLNDPHATAIDTNNEFLYIADTGNSIIRVVDVKNDKITTVAGKAGSFGYSGDNGQATSAYLNHPNGICISVCGSYLYIADTFNHRIRKVNLATGSINTISGSGNTGYSGDGGAATSALLFLPRAVAVDNSNRLYISDTENCVIRKVTESDNSSIITTIAGNGSVTGGYYNTALQDGVDGTSATLLYPRGIVLDSTYDNLYITDTDNNRIRKLAFAESKIYTVAGSSLSNGQTIVNNIDATSSTLIVPLSVQVDNNFIFIADSISKQVRMVTTSNSESITDDKSILGLIIAAIFASIFATIYYLYRLFHYESQILQIHFTGKGINQATTMLDNTGSTKAGLLSKIATQKSPLHDNDMKNLHNYRSNSWGSVDDNCSTDTNGFDDIESYGIYRISVNADPSAKL